MGIVIVLLVLFSSPAFAATLPALPQAQVNVTMPTVTGSTLNATCATLQAQINAAAALNVNLTHQVILATGTTCTGPYKMPSHTGGTGWILITGPNTSQLPSGVRVSPGQASLMPQVRYGEFDEGAFTRVGAFSFMPGAQRYRFIGIDIIQNSAFSPNWAFVITGYGDQGGTNTGFAIFDRCLFRDLDTAHETLRAVYAEADLGHTAMIDSYVSGIQDVGNNNDVQAWLSINNPGPILIRNNYLEASTENILFGGDAPLTESLSPKDITITKNTLAKISRWWGAGNHLTKCLLELKIAKRVLIEGNDFLDMPWNDGGYTMRLTVRNEPSLVNPAPFAEVSDVTIRHNLVKNNTNFIFAHGSDDLGPSNLSRHSKRWHIHNNLIYGLGWLCGGGAPCGAFMLINDGGTNCTDPTPTCQIEDLTIAHNTVDRVSGGTGDWWVMQLATTNQRNLDFRDNLIHISAGRGFLGGGNYGTNGLNAYYGATWIWLNNRIAAIGGGEDTLTYPQGTNTYPANSSGFAWKNAAAGDYTLLPSSAAKNAASDGTDQGVHFASYLAARNTTNIPVSWSRFMPLFLH